MQPIRYYILRIIVRSKGSTTNFTVIYCDTNFTEQYIAYCLDDIVWTIVWTIEHRYFPI